MSKEITPHIIWKALLFVAALGILALALFGCNPVKRVLKDSAKMEQVFNEGVKKGWCVNDSVYISDTTILFDTLHAIDYKSDTVRIGDSVWIDRVEYREKTITKTVTIRDTTIVTDNSRINLLQKELIKKDGELIAKNDELTKSKSETKHQRQRARKAWTIVWITAFAFFVFLFRRPLKFLINRVSPIKL